MTCLLPVTYSYDCLLRDVGRVLQLCKQLKRLANQRCVARQFSVVSCLPYFVLQYVDVYGTSTSIQCRCYDRVSEVVEILKSKVPSKLQKNVSISKTDVDRSLSSPPPLSSTDLLMPICDFVSSSFPILVVSHTSNVSVLIDLSQQTTTSAEFAVKKFHRINISSTVDPKARLRVCVRFIDRADLWLDCHSSDSLSAVKYLVAGWYPDIGVANQRLFRGGEMLFSDESTLSSFGVSTGKLELYLVQSVGVNTQGFRCELVSRTKGFSTLKCTPVGSQVIRRLIEFLKHFPSLESLDLLPTRSIETLLVDGYSLVADCRYRVEQHHISGHNLSGSEWIDETEDCTSKLSVSSSVHVPHVQQCSVPVDLTVSPRKKRKKLCYETIDLTV
jgi:hypothetical protein